MPFTPRRSAFTLIELLIVVAIIAILAAIAVPNFLSAQTRAKVSRAKSDHRTISTGLESYYVDWNRYPRSNTSSRALEPPSFAGRVGYKPTLERLTTPVAYLSGGGVFEDPFKAIATYQGANLETVAPIASYVSDFANFQLYWYMARSDENASIWDDSDREPFWYLLESAGPDLHHHNIGTALNTLRDNGPAELGFINKAIYDPSNGVVSRGSIWRTGGVPAQPDAALYFAVKAAE